MKVMSVSALRVNAALVAGLSALLTAIWAAAGDSDFWPRYTLIWLGAVLVAHAGLIATSRRPPHRPLTRGLRSQLVVSAVWWLSLVAVWLVGPSSAFWPAWVLLALVVAAGAHLGVTMVLARSQRVLSERVGVLTSTRAGAVEEQEAQLRRIEHDLHDGAQARLVALGMTLGLAEQRFRDDPETAVRLVAEAREGAREALRDLRDLARGIHPPILTDRGLGPALQALVAGAPLAVELHVVVSRRPLPAVETAAYFVAAEALANALKHGQPGHVRISVTQQQRLRVEVTDDGRGGADPAGGGLTGLRRRVEALDGALMIVSPPGGPTVIIAEIPCGS